MGNGKEYLPPETGHDRISFQRDATSMSVGSWEILERTGVPEGRPGPHPHMGPHKSMV